MEHPSTPANAPSSRGLHPEETTNQIVNDALPVLGYPEAMIVLLVTQHYQLLEEKKIVPKSVVAYPPQSGWSEFPKNLPRGSAVQTLIRKLPYVKYRDTGGYEVYPSAIAIDYRSGTGVNGEAIDTFCSAFNDVDLVYAMPARPNGSWVCFKLDGSLVILFDFDSQRNSTKLDKGRVYYKKREFPLEGFFAAMKTGTGPRGGLKRIHDDHGNPREVVFPRAILSGLK
ncbi:hypothetical protein EMPG_16408 [Blastomyces silverae]|uniref:Uncharacterized protein n=1 Tax=Blastomyces silverae TaxID=2060906 RepID=A0A0H1B9T3_9EURO|nr:hypothetical protein EMPG_16408 [Blastomyces silverae]